METSTIGFKNSVEELWLQPIKLKVTNNLDVTETSFQLITALSTLAFYSQSNHWFCTFPQCHLALSNVVFSPKSQFPPMAFCSFDTSMLHLSSWDYHLSRSAATGPRTTELWPLMLNRCSSAAENGMNSSSTVAGFTGVSSALKCHQAFIFACCVTNCTIQPGEQSWPKFNP